MGIKELLEKAKQKRLEKKEIFKRMEDEIRFRKLIEEKSKSANERELERFMNENREEQIKFELDKQRKIRERDIKFNHNPLNTPNITNKVSWEVMKEKNMFANNKNMFVGQPFIHKNSKNLLKNNKKLLR